MHHLSWNMACPQKENGYTAIANETMEALAGIRINGEARQCLDVIFRKTYGFNKKKDRIALSQFAFLTKLSKRNVIRALQKLTKLNIIVVQIDNEKGTSYWFNKDYSSWKPLSKKTLVSKLTTAGVQMDNDSLSKLTPTIVDNTKVDNKSKKNLILNEELMKEIKLGKSVMIYLARVYLEAKHLVINYAAGDTFDASKIAKGLAKIYHEAKDNPEETARRIRLAGEYFDQRGLSWKAETAWNSWEDINQWEKDGKPEKREIIKIKKTNDPRYE